MSIDRIKELKKKCIEDDKLTNYDAENYDWLMYAMADYLIEEHEQKENEIIQAMMKKQNEDVHGILGNTVEVGQIWRFKEGDGSIEVFDEEPGGWFYVIQSDGKSGSIEHCDFAYYELVTMENIKIGEYFKCIYAGIEGIEVGKVYKMVEIDKCGQILIDNCYYQRRQFEPCLPPMEEETKEPVKKFILSGYDENMNVKEETIEVNLDRIVRVTEVEEKLYTQEQLDKAVKEAMAEGDRHHYNNGWNDCLYEVNRLKPKCAEYNYMEDEN